MIASLYIRMSRSITFTAPAAPGDKTLLQLLQLVELAPELAPELGPELAPDDPPAEE